MKFYFEYEYCLVVRIMSLEETEAYETKLFYSKWKENSKGDKNTGNILTIFALNVQKVNVQKYTPN